MYRNKYKKGISTIFNYCCQWSQIFKTKNIGSIKYKFLEFHSKYNEINEDNWNKFIDENLGRDKINEMTDKAWDYFLEIRDNVNQVTYEDMKKYIENIIYKKSFNGLSKEYNILKDIASTYNYTFRYSDASDEKNNIDGWLNDKPIQIKPESYYGIQKKNPGSVSKEVFTIYYRENKDGLIYDFNKEDFRKYYEK